MNVRNGVFMFCIYTWHFGSSHVVSQILGCLLCSAPTLVRIYYTTQEDKERKKERHTSSLFGISLKVTLTWGHHDLGASLPLVMPPSLVSCFSAFIVNETPVICLLSRFEVTCFRRTAGRRKFGEIWGFPHQIFRGGVKKIFARRVSCLTPHQTCVQISWRSERLKSVVL